MVFGIFSGGRRPRGLGEAGHYRVPLNKSAGRLPSADVHDAGRDIGGEPDQRLAGSQAGGTVVEVERKAVEEGHGLRAPAAGKMYSRIFIVLGSILASLLVPNSQKKGVLFCKITMP